MSRPPPGVGGLRLGDPVEVRGDVGLVGGVRRRDQCARGVLARFDARTGWPVVLLDDGGERAFRPEVLVPRTAGR